MVTDGRGTSHLFRNTRGAARPKPEFKRWVLSGDGLDVGDRIRLYWHRPVNRPARLRIAIDGPVSKPAHIVSITDDTVAAFALTSDQDTTRTWQFAINFRQEDVMATGIASNPHRLAGQVITLSCRFEPCANSDQPMADAADRWQ